MDRYLLVYRIGKCRATIPHNSPTRLKLGLAVNSTIKKIRRLIPNCPVVLCGDYNDEPFDDSVVHGIGATRDATLLLKRSNALFNPFWPLMGSKSCSSGPSGSYLGGSSVSSMLMFDHMMMCSSTLRDWTMSGRAIINEILPDEWCKISDHYPISMTLQRKS
jgi:hypothetical protein